MRYSSWSMGLHDEVHQRQNIYGKANRKAPNSPVKDYPRTWKYSSMHSNGKTLLGALLNWKNDHRTCCSLQRLDNITRKRDCTPLQRGYGRKWNLTRKPCNQASHRHVSYLHLLRDL